MSAAVKITCTDHVPAELRALAAKSDDAAKTRRLLAIAMVLEKTSRLDAARRTGMDRQTLRDWVLRYNKDGIEGLASHKPPGAPPKLRARPGTIESHCRPERAGFSAESLDDIIVG